MRKSRLILTLLAVALSQLVASPENAAIIAATKTFMAANATLTTKINVTVERVEGNFARARVNPQDRGAADPAWVFLKKDEGKWTGLTVGTFFEAEDYQKLGIPKSLRID
jgi:hypothetical protein